MPEAFSADFPAFFLAGFAEAFSADLPETLSAGLPASFSACFAEAFSAAALADGCSAAALERFSSGLLDAFWSTPDSAAGASITDKVENAVVKTDDGYVFELKLPVEFFKVLDVENASDFVYGKENLYFGMFLVAGGQGYTNQSAAPGNDWTCKGLGLHEYIAY